MRLSINMVVLTEKTAGKPKGHPELAHERTKLYSTKANLPQARTSSFISEWWDASCDAYMTGREMNLKSMTILVSLTS